MPATFVNGSIPCIDFEQITVAGTAIGCTTSKLVVQTATGPVTEGQQYIDTKRVDEAFFQVETASIRVTFDGTTPTSTVGFLFAVGDTFTVYGHGNVVKVKAIRVAGSGQLNVAYFRRG